LGCAIYASTRYKEVEEVAYFRETQSHPSHNCPSELDNHLSHSILNTNIFQPLLSIFYKSLIMGCAFSTPRKVEEGSQDGFDASEGKFSAIGKNEQIRVYSNLNTLAAAPTNALPPKYSVIANPVTADPKNSILQVFKEAHEYNNAREGIKGAFNTLRHRHYQVWIDDTPNLPRTTREATIMTAMLLLTLGKSFGSNMEFFFTGYSNINGGKLSEPNRKRAAALDSLFNTDTWDRAVDMIKSVEDFEHEDLQLHLWLKKLEQSLQAANPSRIFTASGAPARRTILLNSSEARVTSVAKHDENHLELLARIRELKTLYWQGWHQRELEVTELQSLYSQAMDVRLKQPKSLNNTRFTIDQAFALQRRLQERTNAHPTTVIIITGSPLLKKEAQGIKRDQERVQDGANEFSIEVVLLCDHLDKESVENHRQIDDNLRGDRDIYDMTELSEAKFLRSGPGSMLLEKILNSHVRGVDKSQLNGINKYGQDLRVEKGRLPMIPSVEQTEAELDL
jgi:hypothetical protein